MDRPGVMKVLVLEKAEGKGKGTRDVKKAGLGKTRFEIVEAPLGEKEAEGDAAKKDDVSAKPAWYDPTKVSEVEEAYFRGLKGYKEEVRAGKGKEWWMDYYPGTAVLGANLFLLC